MLTASLSASSPSWGKNYWTKVKEVQPDAQLIFNGVLEGKAFENSEITNW